MEARAVHALSRLVDRGFSYIVEMGLCVEEKRMRLITWWSTFIAGLVGGVLGCVSAAADTPRFEISFPASVHAAPITGRLLVVISPRAEPEPRLGLRATNPVGYRPDRGANFAGIDVDALAPAQVAVVDGGAASYPLEPAELPAGDYFVQAVLARFTEVRRADGHTIWVPITDRRANFHQLPGNLFSKPAPIRLGGRSAPTVKLLLTEIIPPMPEPQDTPWVRHVRMKSEVLSRFWGVPMYLRAHVLLPRGFADNPDVRYPGVYLFGHGDPPFGFNTDPASHEPSLAGARDANLDTGYELYQDWNSDGFPRVVAITFEMPSPYFVESYAVNSANNGPFGDALTREMIPLLEHTFRLIPQRYARVVEGNSTGGWEALAMQLHYPQLFGGAWVLNPDPIDFHRYQRVDIYSDENMFTVPLPPFTTTERPWRRDREGQPLFYVRDMARYEAALGTRGRSGAQLDIWQATHGPVGPDGYPVLLFDKQTGAIDRQVAEYMREHGYDLTEYARRNWETLGPMLAGRLKFITGEMDDFYLNLGVYSFEEMLKETAGSDHGVQFEYGRPKKGHNWHHATWANLVREMAEVIRRHAPAGADTGQWLYD